MKLKSTLKLVVLLAIAGCTFYFFSFGSTEKSDVDLETPSAATENAIQPIYTDTLPAEIKNNPIVATHNPMRDSIIQFAETLLGTPYVAAGCSKNGFDCSGFVYYVFQNFNINVPRTSSAFGTFGNEVSLDQIQLGDVVVFLSPSRNKIGHVGIVSKANGMQSEFIHATSGKAMQVVVSSLTQEGYKKRFVKVVNVLEH